MECKIKSTRKRGVILAKERKGGKFAFRTEYIFKGEHQRKPGKMEEIKKAHPPTLYDWAGGMEVFEELISRFYSKVVEDELLKPVFAKMSEEHQKHVAHFIAEVFGGPKLYTKKGGSHHGMIQKHLSKHLTEKHRRRWMDLLLETADEINLPDDPEFRSAFVAYLEWGTRLAVINSNVSEVEMSHEEPMPKWGWGVPGGPYLED